MSILNHTLGIVFRPEYEWKVIRNESHSFVQVFLGNIPFLALIPAISAFVGVTQVGWTVGGGDPIKLTFESALTLCGLSYVAMLIGVYVLGKSIYWMTRTYGVTDTTEVREYKSSALAVYVTTPIFLAGIAGLYPQLWFLGGCLLLAAGYAVFLIYEGIPILMEMDKDRAFMFASSVVTVGLVMLVLTLVSSVIIWGMGVGPVYVD